MTVLVMLLFACLLWGIFAVSYFDRRGIPPTAGPLWVVFGPVTMVAVLTIGYILGGS